MSGSMDMSVDAVLGPLKDFQRKTVEHVFRRMYLDDDPALRFLVADEVGLGKTLVARGLIARAVQHLERNFDVERIDVVYICSNTAIAQQNINRLNVTGVDDVAFASRLTMLPTQLKDLEGNRINFVSFTPGTTFELKSRCGRWEERRVLHEMLRRERDLHRRGLKNMLRCGVTRENWSIHLKEWDEEINPDIQRRFLNRIRDNRKLWRCLRQTCRDFAAVPTKPPDGMAGVRNEVVGSLRKELASICVSALEPDIVILDEFQRFRHLLNGDDYAAKLAQELIQFQDEEAGMNCRVILLSATPYKMLTLSHEEDENHYEDFMDTLEFLFDDADNVEQIRQDLERYRLALYDYSGGTDERLARLQDSLQRRLMSVMVRTERVAVSERRDAMVDETQDIGDLAVEDILQGATVDQVARALNSYDAIEYWKSAPYVLNFMKGYKLKQQVEECREVANPRAVSALADIASQAFTEDDIRRYEPIQLCNPRLRALHSETVQSGDWKLLWMPPSLPYTEPGGVFTECPATTKSLVFSAWNVVPDAISVLLSYDAERQMITENGDHPDYFDLYEERRPLLRFSRGAEDRLTGMSALTLLYPSPALSRLVDPLQLALAHDEMPTVAELTDTVEERLREQVQALLPVREYESGLVDEQWHWAILGMLDTEDERAFEWCESRHGWRAIGPDPSGDEAGNVFREHVDHFMEAFHGGITLRRPPEDLSEVVAEFALGGPAICAARSLKRVVPKVAFNDVNLMNASARIASGFRSLFNMPESQAILRSDETDIPYWRLVLRYCIDGNLQAVMDEYVHVLYESLGLIDHDDAQVVEEISKVIAQVLSLRVASLVVDEISVDEKTETVNIAPLRMRCRYALRFGKASDEQGAVVRAGAVRNAFNSPFRPFVLATTSIGQEGLDFHTYCHRVWHWNLPGNPVDMEQREGRVHRYKGHAIRKNVARRFGLEVLRNQSDKSDPWNVLFSAARHSRPQSANDLIPFWMFDDVQSPAQVERRVPMLPFSREIGKLRRLKRSLAIYRLAFGQPRQDDLLAYLSTRAASRHSTLNRYRLNLSAS